MQMASSLHTSTLAIMLLFMQHHNHGLLCFFFVILINVVSCVSLYRMAVMQVMNNNCGGTVNYTDV